MGTWQAKFGSVAQMSASPGGWCVLTVAGTVYSGFNDQAALVAASKFSSATKQLKVTEEFPPNALHTSVGGGAQIAFNIDKSAILIDGVPTDYFSLPAGFRVLTANFRLATNAQGGTTHVQVNNQDILVAAPDNGANRTLAIPNSINPIDIFNNTYGVQFTTTAGWQPPTTASIGGTNTDGIVIEGTYDLLASSFSWDVPNSSTPIHLLANTIINSGSLIASSGVVKRRIGNPKANPTILNNYGDTVTVIAPASLSSIMPLNLLNISAWYLEVTPDYLNPYLTFPPPPIPFVFETSPNVNFIPITPDLILEWTPIIFKFILPITIYPIIIDYWINNPIRPPIPITIIAVGDGTQFSGSVVLGTLTIILADASGIYVIDDSKTNDTLYFRGGYTTDVNVSLVFPWGVDEVDMDDFYSMLAFPYKILSRAYIGEETDDEEELFIRASLRTVIITEDVEIPSPFIQTAFVP